MNLMENIRNLFEIEMLLILMLIFLAQTIGAAEGDKEEGSDMRAVQELPEESTEDGLARRTALYNPENKRDPFKPFIRLLKEETTGISDLVPPIKRYQLQEFRLVGIIWIEGESRAMVIDPEKNTYYLEKGDEIGNREGKIVQIGEDGMLVEERRYLEDVFGNRKVEVDKVLMAFQE